jgi:serine/threonine protein kinase
VKRQDNEKTSGVLMESEKKIEKQLTSKKPPATKTPKLEDFEIIRVIGKGGFSTVYEGICSQNLKLV